MLFDPTFVLTTGIRVRPRFRHACNLRAPAISVLLLSTMIGQRRPSLRMEFSKEVRSPSSARNVDLTMMLLISITNSSVCIM